MRCLDSGLAVIVLAVLGLPACGGGGAQGKPVKTDATHGAVRGRVSPAAAGTDVALCADDGSGGCAFRAALADRTDASGRFAISMVPPGRYVVVLVPAGTTVADGAAIPLATTPKSGDGFVQVSMSVDNGQAKLKADLELEHHVVESGGQVGQDMGPGFLELVVLEHKGTGLEIPLVQSAPVAASVEAGKAIAVEVKLARAAGRQRWQPPAPKGGTVEGRATEIQSGAARSGATVVLCELEGDARCTLRGTRTAQTDASGAFAIRDVPAGRYTVAAGATFEDGAAIELTADRALRVLPGSSMDIAADGRPVVRGPATDVKTGLTLQFDEGKLAPVEVRVGEVTRAELRLPAP